MENSTDSRTGRLRYIYSTLSIYLARVELVKVSERLISPGAPSLEAFYTHVISAPSLHRASTDALIHDGPCLTQNTVMKTTHKISYHIYALCKLVLKCTFLGHTHKASGSTRLNQSYIKYG